MGAEEQHEEARTPPARNERHSVALHGALGFAFGYLLLHPVAMIIFRWLDPSLRHHVAATAGDSTWDPVVHSFRLEMVPMGIVFGLIAALAAVVEARWRGALARHRDELREQARQLRERNEQLARLERANRRTARFMVHDFKTHLGCILGFTDLLLARADRGDAAAATALDRIRRQAHRMLAAVRDLLAFAALQETGALRRETISVAYLLHEVAAELSLPAHVGGVLVCEFHRACPSLRSDRRLLARVLANLASNSIRHNGPATEVFIDPEPDPKSTRLNSSH